MLNKYQKCLEENIFDSNFAKQKRFTLSESTSEWSKY